MPDAIHCAAALYEVECVQHLLKPLKTCISEGKKAKLASLLEDLDALRTQIRNLHEAYDSPQNLAAVPQPNPAATVMQLAPAVVALLGTNAPAATAVEQPVDQTDGVEENPALPRAKEGNATENPAGPDFAAQPQPEEHAEEPETPAAEEVVAGNPEQDVNEGNEAEEQEESEDNEAEESEEAIEGEIEDDLPQNRGFWRGTAHFFASVFYKTCTAVASLLEPFADLEKEEEPE
ncbi:hypothetical protein AGMMS49949_02180 [Alphaproteobacteria bacterium]|nr:hypothetical protein AGMMS49949_02180 [Alphaproteobacteria bacterium]GHS96112.1 hypothetical protein AGMMS50296_1920 [Alphaproteobacteria bacterium]